MQSFFCLPTSCRSATAIFFSHFIHSGVARASRANELSMLWPLISDLCILPCQSGRRLALASSDFNELPPRESANLPILRKPWPAGPEKVPQGVQFQREGDVTAIAQQRHFENSQECRARDVINPFRERVIVPHFPEETAYESAECQRDHSAPVALAEVLQKMRPSHPVVKRLENQNERS